MLRSTQFVKLVPLKNKKPLQETDIPLYPMAQLTLDLSRPYPVSLSGNKYIIAFVDWFSGWAEACAVPDKTADTPVNGGDISTIWSSVGHCNG